MSYFMSKHTRILWRIEHIWFGSSDLFLDMYSGIVCSVLTYELCWNFFSSFWFYWARNGFEHVENHCACTIILNDDAPHGCMFTYIWLFCHKVYQSFKRKRNKFNKNCLLAQFLNAKHLLEFGQVIAKIYLWLMHTSLFISSRQILNSCNRLWSCVSEHLFLIIIFYFKFYIGKGQTF